MDIHTNCSFCGKPIVRRKQAKSKNVKRHFCDIRCKAEYQKLARPVTKEWLEDHYVVQGLDCVQIGRIVNRDPKSVWNWLKDFGIPTRPRGGATAPGSFRTGDVNPFKGKHHTEETKKKLSEIAKEDGRVPYDPEIGSYMKGRKGEDTPNWKGGITPERQAFYSSDEWKAVVVEVWKRDNATCQRCGLDYRIVDRENVQFAIHHIESFAEREKRADLDNLILLCRKCHLWVHSNSNTEKEFIK